MRMAPLTSTPNVVLVAAPRRMRADVSASGAAPSTATRSDRPGPAADAVEGVSHLRRARAGRKKGDAATCQSYRKGKNGEKECADPKKKPKRKGAKVALVRT